MDCNFTTIKTCELKDSAFRSRILDFGDFDISDYTFSAVYKAGFDQIISEQEITPIGNILTVPLEAIESASNRAKVEVWMFRDGGFKDKVIVFDVVISATGCPSDSTITDGVSVTFGGLKVPVVITQSIVNINLDWESLRPEHILELQQPAIDAGNEVRQQVNEYIDTKELQINPVILAAENATQEANDAAQTANTAAQNADEKATAAQTAANNANDATSEANQAATDANNAASEANQAAQTANAARGWSPVLAIDSQTIPNKSLMIIEDWTGGTGEKPTIGQNQWLKVGGGFTGDPMEAENIKGKQGEIAVLEFEVNDEMDLIQYTEGEELNFAISPDGDLTLTF